MLSTITALPVWIWIGVLTLFVVLLFNYLIKPDGGTVLWLPNEKIYMEPTTNQNTSFASTSTPPSVDISVIVPAFDEKDRINVMLDAALSYLKQRKQRHPSFSYEIIVVDDGSRDNTSDIALTYVKKEGADVVRLLTLQKNRGKGGAVKRGMLCGRGRYLLMADADGATDITDLERLEKELYKIEREGNAVAVGSRAHLVDSDAVAKRTLFRNTLMYGFHILVSVLGVRAIKDTQCGFKLFSRKAAHALFSNLYIERWAFDVELLIPVVEVPVNWREIPGSKLSPIDASIQMAKDLARIRLAYRLGFWKVSKLKAD